MVKLRIIFEKAGEAVIEILDRSPRTAEALLKAVPFTSKARIWGEEIYFWILSLIHI
mgnify:CR=1 FL=1